MSKRDVVDLRQIPGMLLPRRAAQIVCINTTQTTHTRMCRLFLHYRHFRQEGLFVTG